MKGRSVFIFIFLLSSAIRAKVPTWSQDVAPVLYNHCTICHNAKGLAPKSFINYADVYDNRIAIKNAVVTHYMPPWLPDPDYRRFCNERILSPAEIKSIVDWVNSGAPHGDSTKAPPIPTYSDEASLKAPDWSARIPSYTVTDSSDVLRCFVIPSGLLTDKYITQLEIIPGNKSMVHHVAVYEDTSATPSQLDAMDPGPGYTNFGGTGSASSMMIGAWAPGAYFGHPLPVGMGILLHAHTNIIIQIHYPAGAINKTDSTRISMKLSDGPLRRVKYFAFIHSSMIDNDEFFIPANTVRVFTAHNSIHEDVTLLSVAGHMHLIGHSISCWAVTPEGETIPLINIPHWDFHWQAMFDFPKLQKIPAGTVIHSSAVYDNTANNHDNPSHPPKDVSLGEKTTDEMMFVAFAYTAYQPGDENIVPDGCVLSSMPEGGTKPATTLYDLHPDAITRGLSIEFYLAQAASVSLSIYDESGKFISAIATDEKNYAEGFHSVPFDMHSLKYGIFFLKMQTKDETFVRKLVNASNSIENK